jgi:glycosyltransferase involved in cell wall biosynthesis
VHVAAASTSNRRSITDRCKDLIKKLFKESPDPHILWVPFAFWKGVRLLLREHVDLIYCSTPPHSSHLAAYFLAKCFRKPLVVDFRDPWYVNGSVRSPIHKFSWCRKLETMAKRAIVHRAARVISVSAGERDELRREFPELSERNFAFITNGFDPSDMPREHPGGTGSGKLTLIHAGTLYYDIAGEFFEAIGRLMVEHPGVESRMEVQFVGPVAVEYLSAVRALEAAGIATNHGVRSHDETLRRVLASDIPVILLGGSKFLPSHIPAKVFEYLLVGKPILTIARAGEVVDIVERSGLGIVVSPGSIDELTQVLWRLCEDHAAGRLRRVPNPSYIRSFERAALAETLAGIFDAVTGKSSAQS